MAGPFEFPGTVSFIKRRLGSGECYDGMTLIWRSLPLPICLVIIQLVAFLRRVFSMALQH